MAGYNTPYDAAFAHWYPIYLKAWASRPAADRHYARLDIEKTLPLHEHDLTSAYLGKLYAELDAIRDVALAERRHFAAKIARNAQAAA